MRLTPCLSVLSMSHVYHTSNAHILTLFECMHAASLSCLACPLQSSSPSSSMYLSDCLCNSRTSGPNGGPCLPCAPATYKAISGSAVCSSCPENATSLEASASVNDCYCGVGFFGPVGSPCQEEVNSAFGCLPVLSFSLSFCLSLSCARAPALSLPLVLYS